MASAQNGVAGNPLISHIFLPSGEQQHPFFVSPLECVKRRGVTYGVSSDAIICKSKWFLPDKIETTLICHDYYFPDKWSMSIAQLG